ncbi:MAG: hypothetical protein V3T84_10555 [Phycisphaerales bacterium]
MNKAFGFGVAATMVIGGVASADILYDNPVGAGGGTAINQEFGDFPTYSTYLVADFNVPNPGFTLTSVVAPMTVNGAWAAVTTARLHLFAVTGNLPDNITDDPSASRIVPVSYDPQTGILSTVGLSLDVAAGDYWIGLTGIGDFGGIGQAFTLEGANEAGLPDAARNPGGSFNFPAGTDWFAIETFDAWQFHSFALTVEGDPIPPGNCPWDLDNSGVVGATDLLSLLVNWGKCADCDDCPADFDGNCTVGATDLLALLVNWGPCPVGAVIIDFQVLEIDDGNIHNWGYHYEEDGFQLDHPKSEPFEFATFGTQESRYPGSTALFNSTANGVTTLTRIGGGAFDVQSIDISNVNNNGPVTVNFTGNIQGGGQVFDNFTTSGSPNMLETHVFTDFNNLESMVWVQESPFHQFDNITVVPVEP